MKYMGKDADFVALKESQENLIDILLMNVYNEGFLKCNSGITNLYTEARSAIEQGLIESIPENQNPFIDIVKEYIRVNKDIEPIKVK